jgi:undecaprenyl-diphosphatase
VRFKSPSRNPARLDRLDAAGTELLAFAIVAALALSESGRRLDDRAFERLHLALTATRTRRMMAWVASFGGWFGTAVVVSFLMLLRGRPMTALRVFVAAALAWSAAQTLKSVVGLERPWDRLEGVRRTGGIPRGSAFPSGHPAVAAAIWRAVWQDRSVPLLFRLVLGGSSVLVAVARIGVGAHYPADVVAGWLLGDAVGRITSAAL